MTKEGISLFFVFAAHQSQIRGVAIDGINQQVITAGADCNLKVCLLKAVVGKRCTELTWCAYLASFFAVLEFQGQKPSSHTNL